MAAPGRPHRGSAWRRAPRARWRRSSKRWSAPTGSAEPAYEALQHRFEVLGGYTLDQRVDEALSGLGFSRDDVARPPTSLSGGEQTRAALARLVIADPGPAPARRADQPPRPRRPRVARGASPPARRLAPRRLPRSRVPRRDASTAIWELRDRQPDGLPWRLQLLPPPARGARPARARSPRTTHEQQIARERELVQTLPQPSQAWRRCTSTRPASSA